jgi:hypothetical protein
MKTLTIAASVAALLAATAPAAFAQSAGSSAMAPAATTTAATTLTSDGDTFYQTTQGGFTLASNWIGTDVKGAANENIGEVKDVIVGPDGKVAAAIVSVGGFLGIGEKDVAVNLASLSAATEAGDDDQVLMVNTTKEALEAAPAFVKPDVETALLNPAWAGGVPTDPTATGSTGVTNGSAMDSGMTATPPAATTGTDAMGTSGAMGTTGTAGTAAPAQ